MSHRRWTIMLLLFALALTGAMIACDDDPSTSSGQADDDNDTADNPSDDDQIDDDALDDDTTDDDTGDDDTTDDDTTDDDTTDDDTITDDYENPLCKEWNEDPAWLNDPVNIHCLVEKGEFADPTAPVPDELRVVDWNIERGHSLDEYIDLFLNDPTLAQADILLLQEVDRYCPRTGNRNVARELAEALQMDYVYGVEFVETKQQRGEHGNAVLSRFPIVGAKMLRHTDFEQWYLESNEPRLGGRMTIMADLQLGDEIVRVASVHYSSGVRYYLRAHQTQTQESMDMMSGFAGPVIWGGDLNTALWWVLHFEPSVSLILNSGYADALAALSHDENWTIYENPPLPRARLDWIFYRAIDTLGGRVLYEEPFNDLSDHLGIYADFIR